MFVRNFLITVAATVVVAILILLSMGAFTGQDAAFTFNSNATIQSWRGFLYSNQIPPTILIWLSVFVSLGAAGLFALIEFRASNRSRRSMLPSAYPLSPRVIMERTRGKFLGDVTVTVLIPAHNEETTLAETLTSLNNGFTRPDRVIVVADNCTDKTVDIAREFKTEIYETIGNTEKKGGALNQILALILDGMGHNDVILILDADTTLNPRFIRAAVQRFTADRAIMAIGGIFKGNPGGGLLGLLQRNEYDRYERKINRRRGKVFVLTGTATMFRAVGLKEVAANRGVTIGGTKGSVFDTVSLTEDNELTLALKSLGALMESPKECVVETELMPTFGMLWHQRMRWQRGALENISSYGITPATFRYWGQQLGIAYGVVALNLFLLMLAIMALSLDKWIWYPFWLGVGLIFAFERVFTVWDSGWAARLLAVTLIPELLYELYIQAIFVKCLFDIAFGNDATWKHVTYSEKVTSASSASANSSSASSASATTTSINR